MASSFLCRTLLLAAIAALVAACQPAGRSSGSPVDSSDASRSSREAAGWHPDSVAVLPGETLFAISRRYDVPIRAIIDANRLEPPYAVRAGQTLTLPQVRTHLVRAGDTLYSVSRQYGVDVATLAETNHLQAPFTIKTGTTLVLPPTVASAPSSTPAASGKPPEVDVTALPPPSARPPSTPPPAVPSPPSVQPIAPPTPLAPPAQGAAPRPVPAPSAVPAPAATPPTPQPDQSASLPPPPSSGPKGEARFQWPVRGRVIAHYGPAAGGTHNDGINIAAPTGTPVLAAEAGVVAYAGNELRGYGNLILIKHANGWMTAYAHNAALLVKRGDRVMRGQTIARVGATGTVNEPQLHFEVRRGTRAIDPVEYLPASAASG